MYNKIINRKNIIAFLVIIFCFYNFSLAQALSLQDAFDVDGSGNNDPLDSMASTAGYDTNKTDVLSVVSLLIQSVLGLLGVIFLVLLIYGGFIWMTARENEQKAEKAKATMTNAIIGLVIVFGAYAISYFVVGALSDSVLK
jgi:hypothetical protein